MSVPGRLRLKGKKAFSEVYREGKWTKGKLASLCYLRGERLFAVVASRKVGGAVVRNRARRRLSQAFLSECKAFPPGRYIVAATEGASTAPFGALRDSLVSLAGPQKE